MLWFLYGTTAFPSNCNCYYFSEQKCQTSLNTAVTSTEVTKCKAVAVLFKGFTCPSNTPTEVTKC
jgi:hypothetical protein